MTQQSHIEQLIHNLCPNGVEIKTLGEACDEGLITLGRGNVISKIDIAATPGDYPVYSSSGQGNGEMGRYGLYMFTDKRITWSIDGGGRFFFRDDPYYSVTNVCGWLKVNNGRVLDIRFVYYVLFEQWTHRLFDYTLKAHPSVIRDVYEIPVPPIAIQKEITETIDAFADLIYNIDTEIKERQKQLEILREKLFADLQGRYPEKKLADVAEISRGVRVTKQDLTIGGKYHVYQNSLTPLGQYGKYNTNGNTPFVISAGSAGMVGYSYSPYWAADDCLRVVCCGELDSKYAYYYMLCKQNYFISNVRKGGVPRLSRTIVEQLQIPLPSLKEQQAIAAKLDTIEAFIANLNEERTLRQQQYEYYRAKLISLLK